MAMPELLLSFVCYLIPGDGRQFLLYCMFPALCIIINLNTRVEPKIVLAIIYSTFVWYIILIAKNIYSLIRNANSESLLYLIILPV